MQRINGGNIQIIDTKDIFISALMYCIQVYLSTGPGGDLSAKKKKVLPMWCNFKFECVLFRSGSRHNVRVDSLWECATFRSQVMGLIA